MSVVNFNFTHNVQQLQKPLLCNVLNIYYTMSLKYINLKCETFLYRSKIGISYKYL